MHGATSAPDSRPPGQHRVAVDKCTAHSRVPLRYREPLIHRGAFRCGRPYRRQARRWACHRPAPCIVCVRARPVIARLPRSDFQVHLPYRRATPTRMHEAIDAADERDHCPWRPPTDGSRRLARLGPAPDRGSADPLRRRSVRRAGATAGRRADRRLGLPNIRLPGLPGAVDHAGRQRRRRIARDRVRGSTRRLPGVSMAVRVARGQDASTTRRSDE